MASKQQRPTVVRFENGTYAVRKIDALGTPQFWDLKTEGHWWGKSSSYMKDCVTDSQKVAEAGLNTCHTLKHRQEVRRRVEKDIGKPIIPRTSERESPIGIPEPPEPPEGRRLGISHQDIKEKLKDKLPKMRKWFTD